MMEHLRRASMLSNGGWRFQSRSAVMHVDLRDENARNHASNCVSMRSARQQTGNTRQALNQALD